MNVVTKHDFFGDFSVQGENKNKIKILHAGDIHLDSAFSRYGVASGEQRRRELRSVFSSLIQYIRSSDVDVVLLSGDVFDSEYSTLMTLDMLVREFSSCRAEFFISPGNHDPYKSDSIYASPRFSDNVHIFSDEKLSYFDIERLNTRVYGWAFTGISHTFSPLAGKKIDDKTKINLVCGHCDTESPLSSYCPVSESDISAFEADYAAFSHIHNISEPKKLGDTVYAYSGFLESRSFDERGQGGAWLVEIEKTDGKCCLEYKRLNFGCRRHESITLDVTGATDSESIAQKIQSALKEFSNLSQLCVRVTLTGSVGVQLSLGELNAKSYGVEQIEIRNATTPTYNAEYLLSDMTLKGELYRYLLPSLTEGTPDEREIGAQALRIGLAALEGRDITLESEL